MYKKSFLRPIVLVLLTLFTVSCDKDFNELGTNIVGEDHFGFEKYTDASIKAYNQKLGPIASNNLSINALGFYNNPAFGTTQANFVTQVELASVNPTFNNGPDATEHPNGVSAIDSVVLEIPYFKTFVKKVDKITTYRLDSIYGNVNSKFKLSLYQSNYFLRDLDPNQSFTEQQAFYSDENSTIESNRNSVLLNDAPLSGNNTDGHENDQFYFDNREHKTAAVDGGEAPRSVPSMRLHLNKTVFNSTILNAPDGKLADNVTFKNYFRGLYFKVENGAPGHMAMLNFKGGKITIYYNEDKKKTTGTVVTFERVDKTYVLNLTGNTVSLLQNSNENLDYLNATTSTSEASKLYLKGGEGAISIIDLFSATDTYKYTLKVNGTGDAVDEKGNKIPIDVNGNPSTGYYFTYTKENIANGISDELDDLRYPIYTTFNSVDYYSKRNRWMINEANLTFNIATADMVDPTTIEPGRIFLFDLTNNKVVVDYSFDNTTNGVFPKFSKGVFGGVLLDEDGRILKQRNTDENTGGVYTYKGSKYKIRITNHIRNLIKNDSTNVRLGLSVTESISNVGFSKLRSPNSNIKGAPTSSVLSPLGTILYGTNPSVADDKRLKLEIYYTKPN